MSPKKSFITGAIVLMAAGLIVRLIGFVYRIYISNLLGSEGMGLFQLISPVYSLIILTLTSGVSIAISRLVAQEIARGNFANSRRITLVALLLVFAAGSVVSTILLINARFIADELLKDSRTYYSILLLIPCIPIIALSSTLKGYFYGIQDVTPTAISQVAEQIVRIGLVIVASGKYLERGLEYACAFATAAMSIGEMASLLVLYLMYKIGIKKYMPKKQKGRLMRKRTIVSELLKISLPISSNKFITSTMAAIEYILIPRRLLAGGMNYQESIELYGRLTGMAMPLISFPSLVTSSLAVTLVPAIAEALSLRNYRTLNSRVSKSIQTTLMLGIISSALFMSYPNEIGDVIFKKENVGELLYMLSFSCTFIYLQQTLAGILNGLGKQNVSLRNSIIGYIIRIAFIYFLIPVYGIKIYIIALFVSSIIICVLNLSTVVKTTGMMINIRNWILKPGLVGVIMFLISKYILAFFSMFIKHELLIVCFSVAGNIAVGLMLMAMLGLLRKEHISRMIGLK